MDLKKSLALVLLLAGLCGCSHAQFIGYVAQQTTIQHLIIPAGAPTLQTFTAISNLGQAAHTIQVTYSIPGAHCTTWLQESADNVFWVTIASAPNSSTGALVSTANAVGYYPLLRVVGNANNSASCNSNIQWTYTGYQFPPNFPVGIYNSRHADIAAPVTIAASIEYPDPLIVAGFSCFNPNASVAYLQLGDDSPPPAPLGTFILYEIGIPAGQTFTDSTVVFAGTGLSAGAATAAGGGTPVATPLVCDFQLNLNGPFGPILGLPNSP